MNEATFNYFDKSPITRTYKILCYDKLAHSTSNTQYEYDIRDIVNYKYYQSTNLTWLSSLNLTTSDPNLFGSRIRLLFRQLGCSIIGNSNYTYSLKSNKSMSLLLSLTKLSFPHHETGQQVELYKEEPAKFKVLKELDY